MVSTEYTVSKGRMTAWAVFRKGVQIDTVFYSPSLKADQVKRDLIEHDGFSADIEVRYATAADELTHKQKE